MFESAQVVEGACEWDRLASEEDAAHAKAELTYWSMLAELATLGHLRDLPRATDLESELCDTRHLEALFRLVGTQTPAALPEARAAMDARIGKHVRQLVEKIVGNLADRDAGFVRESLS